MHCCFLCNHSFSLKRYTCCWVHWAGFLSSSAANCFFLVVVFVFYLVKSELRFNFRFQKSRRKVDASLQWYKGNLNWPFFKKLHNCNKKLKSHFCLHNASNYPIQSKTNRTILKAHSHRASTPTLGVHTPTPIFDTGNVILAAMLMMVKIKTFSILSQETLPLHWRWRLVWMGL